MAAHDLEQKDTDFLSSAGDLSTEELQFEHLNCTFLILFSAKHLLEQYEFLVFRHLAEAICLLDLVKSYLQNLHIRFFVILNMT